MQDNLEHSGENVSRWFNKVSIAICRWVPDIIRPKEPLDNIPTHIIEYGGGKCYSFFKDCVGAIDGTHVHANVPKD
ncbi:hypothetical protein QJS10_CPB18g00718 [Acorus calamus]|uniref:DDE Tnp4 domain-containing protein n=1 Tax=Acorus calamus TaxID=4465 RepID=A0AAV9CPI9_ACOCL|nr:hypothetical protein QJS10_CPB18g00718 [Acorus calamus]